MIKKYKIRLTEDEQNIIINGLLNWRNQLIKEGKYTTEYDRRSPSETS